MVAMYYLIALSMRCISGVVNMKSQKKINGALNCSNIACVCTIADFMCCGKQRAMEAMTFEQQYYIGEERSND
jgi:hypothetical protein